MASDEATPAVSAPPPPPPPIKPSPNEPVKDAKPESPGTPRPPPEAVSEADPVPASDSKPINLEIFDQILELDEEGTHDFSKEMVVAYFSQAGTTFKDMDDALAEKKLPKLSELGHFLKGSSAALGISKVQAACEKMQHYGELRDEEAGKDLSPKNALEKIEALLVEVKAEYAQAETWLKKWYKDHNESFDEP
ncbi:histidine-phosphotransfer domain, HPT domain-containing protein [Mycena maculata]|uniref:Histidine-phosphotransfer domain, HPT domain-containing protein n=1 Tax=Mycena maculata TaxID=230809 RepID=A0AAD7HW10_9AGAR|nr:histidine-phosphotransfer domain, HPT domain-containing protein [Mycena maculata]